MKITVLQYAVVSYLIALLIAILLTETGPRQFYGNLSWQCIVCSYILFAVIMVLFAEKVRTFGMRDWNNRLIVMAFISHVIAGVLYIGKIFYTGSYY